MRLFPKRTEKKTYDRSNQKPVIKASICNGEQVAGFKDIRTGKFEEVMLIRRAEDLETFKIFNSIVVYIIDVSTAFYISRLLLSPCLATDHVYYLWRYVISGILSHFILVGIIV